MITLSGTHYPPTNLACISRPDGLYRVCIVCGREIKLGGGSVVTATSTHGGITYTRSVRVGESYLKNLLQVQCYDCGQVGAKPDHVPGNPDPRARLREYGLEGWE